MIHKRPMHSLNLWHFIQLHLWFWLLTAFKIYQLSTRHRVRMWMWKWILRRWIKLSHEIEREYWCCCIKSEKNWMCHRSIRSTITITISMEENLVGFNYTAIFMIILLNVALAILSIVVAAVALRTLRLRKMRSCYHSLHLDLELMNGWPFQLPSNMDN